MMETYYWELPSQRPTGFSYKWGRSAEPCTLKNYRVPPRALHVKGNSRSVGKAPSVPAKAPSPPARPKLVKEFVGKAVLNATPIVSTGSVNEERSVAFYGPFHFAKGPLFFMSSPLAAGLRSSDLIKRQWETTMATTNESSLKGIRPWEDVWTGLALARSAADENLAAVHIGMASFAEGSVRAQHVTCVHMSTPFDRTWIRSQLPPRGRRDQVAPCIHQH